MSGHRLRPASTPRTSAVIAVAAACLVVLAISIWLARPRFELHGPGLIDDWWYVAVVAPQSLGETLRHTFLDLHLEPTGRFLPAGYWNSYFQWHLTGAPEDVYGSHLIGQIIRVLFIQLITIVPAALAWSQRRSPISPWWLFGLALIPPLLVLGSSELGPEIFSRTTLEPQMLTGILGGGVLLLIGLGRWLRRGDGTSAGSDALTAGVIALGLLIFWIGVLTKEPSFSFLLLAPIAYIYLDRRWRSDGVIDRPLHRYTQFRVVALLSLFPFARVVVGALYSLAKDPAQAPYGSTTEAQSGVLGRIADYFSLAWDGQRTTLVAALVLFVAACALLGLLWRRRGTLPLLEAGLIATAVASMLIQTAGYDAAPRYLLPSIVLLSTAVVTLLVNFGPSLRLVAVASAVVFAIANLGEAKTLTDQWIDRLVRGDEALTELRQYDPANCPVYMGSVTGSEAMGIPVMLASDADQDAAGCRPGSAGILLAGPDGPTSYENEGILRACHSEWQQLWTNGLFTISSCARFREGDLGDGQPVSAVLAEDRIVPGHSFLPEGRLATPFAPPE